MNSNETEISERARYRRPKQQRGRDKFEAILDHAELLLSEGASNSFTLIDVSEGLGVALGSIYHFFPSKEGLLLACAERTLDRFAQNSDLENSDLPDIRSWQELWSYVVAPARDQYVNSEAAMNLLLGPACSWDVRLVDSAGNRRIAQSVLRTFNRAFDFSFCPEFEDHLLHAIVINDAFWRMSFREHGTITDAYLDISINAVHAYLGQFLPSHLARKPFEISRIPKVHHLPAAKNSNS